MQNIPFYLLKSKIFIQKGSDIFFKNKEYLFQKYSFLKKAVWPGL